MALTAWLRPIVIVKGGQRQRFCGNIGQFKHLEVGLPQNTGAGDSW